MTGLELVILFTTCTVISNTIVIGVNVKAVNRCMEVIDHAQKY